MLRQGYSKLEKDNHRLNKPKVKVMLMAIHMAGWHPLLSSPATLMTSTDAIAEGTGDTTIKSFARHCRNLPFNSHGGMRSHAGGRVAGGLSFKGQWRPVPGRRGDKYQ